MSEMPQPCTGQRPDFEIGLALAGAISAGAYTAGVIDFLMQALQSWEDARGKGAPAHEVKIRTIAGASAGAITGALGVVAMARGLRPQPLSDAEMRVAQDAPRDRIQRIRCVLPSLYETWVIRPTMVAGSDSGNMDLLGNDDLAVPGPTHDAGSHAHPPGVVQSILNAALLDEIKTKALEFPGYDAKYLSETINTTNNQIPGGQISDKNIQFLSEEMHVFMTVTNLRGIPFTVNFGNAQYDMMTHGDRLHYKIRGVGSHSWPKTSWLATDKCITLDAHTLPKTADDQIPDTWQSYGNTAIASAAFPGGLAPRPIDTPFGQYEDRNYPLPWTTQKIEAKFPKNIDLQSNYKFLSVDGGVVNNSPFDFVEYSLWGWESEREEKRKTGADADRAVIMVAPFPDPPAFLGEGQPPAEVVAVLRALFPTLINQARFRASELGAAMDPRDRSRFLVSPRRSVEGQEPARFPIACGLLGGFGGFLHEEFRAHDFQLGRRNCQRFLETTFGLPSKEGPPRAGAGNGPNRTADSSGSETAADVAFKIVPLVGEALRPVGLPPWPRMTGKEFQHLMGRIKGRFTAVKTPLINAQLAKAELRLTADFLLWIGQSRALKVVELAILSDLVRRDQITGWELPSDLDGIFEGDPEKNPDAYIADDARLILSSLVGPMKTSLSVAELTKATHLKPWFIERVLNALADLPPTAPHRVVTTGQYHTLQMHLPTGLRTVPLIGSLIGRFRPQPYHYG
ncbi:MULTISPECIES: patatin-like phospholipase family protein [Methylobacterium]|uniref:patatin-like phospholipase family protein n=1 Tax=Methylobacterium TaxID=407 RepID=UPI0013ED5EE8|nr:patatin-like phospholipase family protein [Methylobacterium sp. DB0501]NGM35140.1 hypothetical protein [Methylobacterium sp. DB0501]